MVLNKSLNSRMELKEAIDALVELVENNPTQIKQIKDKIFDLVDDLEDEFSEET